MVGEKILRGTEKSLFFHQDFCVGFQGKKSRYSPIINLPSEDTEQLQNEGSPKYMKRPIQSLAFPNLPL